MHSVVLEAAPPPDGWGDFGVAVVVLLVALAVLFLARSAHLNARDRRRDERDRQAVRNRYQR